MNIVSLSLNYPSMSYTEQYLKNPCTKTCSDLFLLLVCTLVMYSFYVLYCCLVTDIRYCKHSFRDIICFLFKMFKNKYYLL
jgi:hypothetical protein